FKGQQNGYTSMPMTFSDLDAVYCSLGSSQNYYEEMMNLPDAVRIDILASLRDCVYTPEVFNEFLNEPAMFASLLRDVSEKAVRVLFPSILRGHARLTPYHFRFLLNNDPATTIDVAVNPDSLPPTNLHVLIGRNGVGKTRIVSGIMDAITKAMHPSPISMPGKLEFAQDDEWDATPSDTERFANLIVVVFSAFDNFQPNRNMEDKDSVPCFYIGLKKENNITFKTQDELRMEFLASFEQCMKSNRRQRWIDAVTTLCSDPIFDEYQLYDLDINVYQKEDIAFVFNNLSSGHRIILLTITRLVELMDEKTLVLIDEPENHLHPPLLSSFIKALSTLAIKRNAVALIATHSPVVLQEVPRTCTTKINRVGSAYAVDMPQFETYGENIDVLTRDVFRLELEDSGFYKSISEHLKNN
ncbi:MAG: ATP-binding protein, partial [Chitinophagaceae bacterium]